MPSERKRKITKRKKKVTCKKGVCKTRKCDLENIDVQIGDSYKVLVLHRYNWDINLHYYIEITNPRKKCVYTFGLNKAEAVGINGPGSVLMIHDPQISRISHKKGLKKKEILTQPEINKMFGEEISEIDHLQKSIIDIFNERSMLYKLGKNKSKVAYLDIDFSLLSICFNDLPGQNTWRSAQPTQINCRKGAVIFHYQPYMFLQMVDEHLVNHNLEGNVPDFKKNAQAASYDNPNSYSSDFISAQSHNTSPLSYHSLPSSYNSALSHFSETTPRQPMRTRIKTSPDPVSPVSRPDIFQQNVPTV